MIKYHYLFTLTVLVILSTQVQIVIPVHVLLPVVCNANDKDSDETITSTSKNTGKISKDLAYYLTTSDITTTTETETTGWSRQREYKWNRIWRNMKNHLPIQLSKNDYNSLDLQPRSKKSVRQYYHTEQQFMVLEVHNDNSNINNNGENNASDEDTSLSTVCTVGNKHFDDETGGVKQQACDVQYYELVEALDLELGIPRAVHVVDYAYSPVSSALETVQNVEMEESPPVMNTGSWWQWWIPWKLLRENSKQWKFYNKYKMDKESYAGGSHGEIWRGRKKHSDNIPLIFKRLRVEKGYRVLEAGLREVYFGNLLLEYTKNSNNNEEETFAENDDNTNISSNNNNNNNLFTEYVEHFFGQDNGELWIIYKDAGTSLRSLLYTGTDTGDYVVYQHSWLWTLIRMSLAGKSETTNNNKYVMAVSGSQKQQSTDDTDIDTGRQLLSTFLRQILESAAFLHSNGIVHRDIKPGNILCKSNLNLQEIQTIHELEQVSVNCVLGDFSSAYNAFTRQNIYTKGPSRLEQTDEYAPPEAIFGYAYRSKNNEEQIIIDPSFDLWSIGIVALELLLGTPHVFSVDQRTRVILSHRMEKAGSTPEEIERAMFLAALSQFCIYNPSDIHKLDWPLRHGDPLHQSAMTKQSCTLNDFHRALRARDPLGWGFEESDLLLHLIWQLLAWDPKDRITAAEALQHPYFGTRDMLPSSSLTPGEHNALESQMLDPRMDFNISDSIDAFYCPKCGRSFGDWHSCHTHTNSRKHANFCTYDHSSLPTCLNAHVMLPAHSSSGYCDIQGRRRTIEDFHAIHLLPHQQFYGIFDGHLGNLASKFTASFLYHEISARFSNVTNTLPEIDWKDSTTSLVTEAFNSVHERFLQIRAATPPHGFMDQSGTTATILFVTDEKFVIASLGDSRAVLSTRQVNGEKDEIRALQLTKDHVASDKDERRLVESRGGLVKRESGMERVNGTLAITRSIGDASLAPFLSREPQVIAMSRVEMLETCGASTDPGFDRSLPCFIIIASDGLWDTVKNEEAVELVALVVKNSSVGNSQHWQESAGLQLAAEALVHEAYIRGSTDNIGVCIVAVE